MEAKSKTRTEQILKVMHVVAWIVVIGLVAEAGAILISYSVSYFNSEGAKNLYMGLNLYKLRELNFWYYTQYVSFLIALPLMKAFMVFLVTKTLSKVNLQNPFTMEVAHILKRISYVLVEIWVVSIISSSHSKWLLNVTGEQLLAKPEGSFLFVAGLVFIISQIFKRGVELQSENELTV
jgi:hypothetical protein